MPSEAQNGSPGGPPGDPEALVGEVQRLFAELERIDDGPARRTAEELLAAVMEIYGDGLERMLAILDDGGDAAAGVRQRFVDDGVIASLLLIHDLYPVPLDERVGEALDSVRPYMESHGGNVELLALEDGVARIRLEGSCEGCPASASTLELAIKQALDEAAPDLAGLEVEGMAEAPAPGNGDGLEIGGTPLPVVQAGPNGSAPEARAAHWMDLPAGINPTEGEVATTEAGGMHVLVANVGGSLLAYRDRCPSCGEEIANGELKGGVLSCPSCERRYYLPRAGRSMDEERLLLEPVPLLGQGGSARIAVSA